MAPPMRYFDYGKKPISAERHEIRLMRLLPADHYEGPIALMYDVVSLNSKPSYTALSYTWGQLPGPDSDISLSLAKAFYRLRAMENVGYLWVDQCCINQGDDEEKSWQVALMKRIYEQAQQVVVFLGEETDASKAGLALAMRMWGVYQSSSNKAALDLSTEFDLRNEQEGLTGLSDIFSRRWFSRKWIIQEVACCASRVVMLGDHLFYWDGFQLLMTCDTVRNMSQIRELNQGAFKRLVAFPISNHFALLHQVIMGLENAQLQPLLVLLQLTMGMGATDPRDHLYSLLGLAKDTGDFPAPDYAQTCEQVFTDFAKTFVSQGHCISLISHAKPHYTNLKIPSWVPDWSQIDPTGYPYQAGNVYAAGGPPETDGCIRCEGDTLVIPGTIIDGVTAVSDALDLLADMGHARLQWLKSALRTMVKHCGDTQAAPAALTSLAKLVVHDGESEKWKLTGEEDAMLRSLITVLTEGWNPREILSDEHLIARSLTTGKWSAEELADYFWALSACTHDLRVATTAGGMVGLTPPTTRTGDRICLFSGARAPYVLRNTQGGKHKFATRMKHILGSRKQAAEENLPEYKLVGEAYIRGAMHGEVLMKPGLTKTEIRLV